MSTDRPKRETMSLEEATVSNMSEIAALVELVEQKRICSKWDLVNTGDQAPKEEPTGRYP